MDEIGKTSPTRPVQTYETLASIIELTMLAPRLSADDIDEGCRTRGSTEIAAVVVRPCDVETRIAMDGRPAPVKVASVAGYPYGTLDDWAPSCTKDAILSASGSGSLTSY